MFWSFLAGAAAKKAGGSVLSSRPFQIFVIVIVIVIVIWYVGRKMGQQEAADKPLPNSGSGIPQVKNSDGSVSSWSPKSLADEIYSKLKGVWTTGISKMNTLNKIMVLTDDQCVALYNYFNKQYGKGDTLTQWIEDEYFMSSKEPIVNRLKSLGLD